MKMKKDLLGTFGRSLAGLAGKIKEKMQEAKKDR